MSTFHYTTRQLNKSKSTVSDYIMRFDKSCLTIKDLNAKTVDEIYNALLPEESKRSKQRLRKILPDFSTIHLELNGEFKDWLFAML